MQLQQHVAVKLLVAFLCFASTAVARGDDAGRPNILLIVADDLGFSDLGCYGSEIETPHLDRLANGGVRLTQFYTTGRCCPSRASLLTGYYPHRVGLGHMTKDIGQAGYRGRVADDVETIAEMLSTRGYRSFLSCKWHLGTHDPTKHGFEEFYGTLTSAKTFWDAEHFLRLPKGREARSYARQGVAANQLNDRRLATAATEFPGASMLPLLRGERLPDRVLFFEHEGNRAVRDGRWKLVSLRGKRRELYDIESDRTELQDMSTKRPEIVKRLSRAWDVWAKENRVTPLPPDFGVEYIPALRPRQASTLLGSNGLLAPKAKVRKLADGFRFTEGPAWDGKGAWYFSDLPNKTLHRWTEGTGVELVRTGVDGFSNGIVVDAEGRLVFCEVSSRRIVRRSADGSEETIADSCDGKPIGMPNDLWLAPNGGIYFTIPRTNKKRARAIPADAVNGTVCLISPKRSHARQSVDEPPPSGVGSYEVRDVGVGVKSPNGIVGTRDGKWLYVADPGSKKCWRYSIQPDGSLANQTVAADKGSDGLAVDECGNLYVTGETIIVFSPNAKRIAEIPVPQRPANMKFGGKDNRTLFITARTGIYAVEMNVRGN